jgi:hypothetical protein
MEKKQGRTRGSHSKCERRIWLQTSGASHAYTLVHATANIGVLQLFLAGLATAAAVLRCSFLEVAFVSDIKLGESHVYLSSFPRYRIRLSCVVTSHYVYRSRHDRER